MNFSAIKREEIPGEIPEIQMSEAERAQISSFIESEFGIKMPAIKKVLLTGRLAKRLRALGFSSYGDYYRFIRSDKGAAELFIFADLISTTKHHFSGKSSILLISIRKFYHALQNPQGQG